MDKIALDTNILIYSHDESLVVVFDRKKRPIELVRVQNAHVDDSSYYLKVSSEPKALKETSMYERFSTRYEDGLASIVKGVTTRGGVKKYDRVNQRIGRLAQKYPSVHHLYEISIQKNDRDVCTSMTWNLQMKHAPFIRKKSVVLKIEPEVARNFDLKVDTS